MTIPRIERIKIQGFRAFGKEAQELVLRAPVSAVWAPNSQGKTSLAEAFEFLLTGQIVRRQLMASSQDEFADALRNAHMPPNLPVYIEAQIRGKDGKTSSVRRSLTSDYAKRQDCQSVLLINDAEADETGLAALGISLSQPPLSAPVLAQHTLGYLFSAKPQDRASYFKTILEVTDLETLRGAIAALEAEFKPGESAYWDRLITASEIAEARPFLEPLTRAVPTAQELAEALDNAVTALLQIEGADVPESITERLEALRTLLAERRAKTFPVSGFDRKIPAEWTSPADTDWEKLSQYLAERSRIDEQTRRLVSLFQEALAIPEIDGATDAVDCVLCGAGGALTPERIEFLRGRVKEAEDFRSAEKEGLEALRRLQTKVSSSVGSIDAAVPAFMKTLSARRRDSGFRIDRINALVGDENEASVTSWIAAVKRLSKTLRHFRRHARQLTAEINEYLDNAERFDDVEPLQLAFDDFGDAYQEYAKQLTTYSEAELLLREHLDAVVDRASDTEGWQQLIDLCDDPEGLREALKDRHARTALKAELSKALSQIDKGNEKVLDDKFGDLSEGIQYWWDLLRPGEHTFFSAVKPRKGARRTVDFKAGLASSNERSSVKVRDVIAVFSQSQLHCLGLALFIARAVHENAGFIILDDPILSSDEDYRAYFKANVVEELLSRGIQVIILTQDQKSWKDLEHRYVHQNIDMFQIEMIDPANGTTVTNNGDDLQAMLTRIEILARGGHADMRKQAGELLRNAAERFCKEMLVRERWAKGQAQVALSDFDGKNLGQLSPQVEPLLGDCPSHPGKLRSIGSELNPAKHDDGIPDKGTLKVALGDLRKLRSTYL